MEKEYKLGSIYGSRISKNGKWLNLTIVTEVNGEKRFIVCPVKMGAPYEGDKPVATILSGDGRAMISQLRVFADEKPKQEEPADDDIPF